NRRSCRQAAARSTRPLPPLVHRIRGRPLRPRRGTRLHCDQTWSHRRPHVCRIEKAREETVSKIVIVEAATRLRIAAAQNSLKPISPAANPCCIILSIGIGRCDGTPQEAANWLKREAARRKP